MLWMGVEIAVTWSRRDVEGNRNRHHPRSALHYVRGREQTFTWPGIVLDCD